MWLESAEMLQPDGETIAAALIGIGHALLANLGSNRPYDFDVTMDDPQHIRDLEAELATNETDPADR
jgi:phosphoribosylformylglycinamidine (FGAM) synthase PurS component